MNFDIQDSTNKDIRNLWHGYKWNCAQDKSKGCLAHYK